MPATWRIGESPQFNEPYRDERCPTKNGRMDGHLNNAVKCFVEHHHIIILPGTKKRGDRLP